MTKEQATAEMKYRLCKYILQVLIDAELITTAEAVFVTLAISLRRILKKTTLTILSKLQFLLCVSFYKKINE